MLAAALPNAPDQTKSESSDEGDESSDEGELGPPCSPLPFPESSDDGDESNGQGELGPPCSPIPLPENRNEGDESSDEGEPMPPKIPTSAKIIPAQPSSDVVYLPCKRKRNTDDADTLMHYERIKVEWSKYCTDAEKVKITSSNTIYAKVVDVLQSCSSKGWIASDEWSIRQFRSQVDKIDSHGGYVAQTPHERLSVNILEWEQFGPRCTLSLV